MTKSLKDLNLFGKLGSLKQLKLTQLDRNKIIVIAAVAAVFLYLDVTFVLRTQLRGIGNAASRIAKLKNDIAVLKRDLTNMETEKQKRNAVKVDPASIKRLITIEQIPELLENISGCAKKNAIKIIQISSSRETRGKADKSAKDEKFSFFLINLDVTGDYHNFGRFLNDVDSLPVVFVLRDMQILPGGGDNLTQNINLTFKVYGKK